MMRCAIMQPSYLPWAGYFNLMANVDQFVFLDDAQFCRATWHQRNRILYKGKVEFLSVPVCRTGQMVTIADALISKKHSNWLVGHLGKIEAAYHLSPYYSDLSELINALSAMQFTHLCELNITIIRMIAEKLVINPKIYLASELNCEGKRSDKLINICELLHVDQYLTPVGAVDYLLEDQFADKSGIDVLIQNYIPPAYTQCKLVSFTSHLSILDVIANLGWAQTAAYVRSPPCSF